ncbi:MAG: betaine--homocysteine S-methyltransferase, partial [Pseudomonadota bacterium]
MGRLRELLAERHFLLADGATGTNLFDVGLVSGDAPELWNVDEPDKIRALHQSFVDAGADIILTNTFGANARRLMLHKAEDRVHELNKRAAELAREVAQTVERPVIVAGSVGPTGDLFQPLGELTEEQARDVFAEQIAGLAEGGVDVIWIETMSAADEMRAAADAAADAVMAAGLDYTVTASFDTAGRTMMGLTPADFATQMMARQVPPVAVGANCGVGASDTLAAILDMTAGLDMTDGLDMTAGQPQLPVISKANAGIPEFHGEHIHYSGSPELMGRYATLAASAGVRIIGGCCGTAPEHLAAMRSALDAFEPGALGRPSLNEIVAATGALVAPAVKAETAQGDDATSGGRRNRRRRARA